MQKKSYCLHRFRFIYLTLIILIYVNYLNSTYVIFIKYEKLESEWQLMFVIEMCDDLGEKQTSVFKMDVIYIHW